MSKAPKKLYAVTIEVVAVVAADSAKDAQQVAQDQAGAIATGTLPDHMAAHVVEEVARLAELPQHWTGMHLPYGHQDGRRIHEYLNAQEA